MANWVTREESISKYGSDRYTGWGKAEADADFKSKGGTPGGGGNSAANDFASVFGSLAGSPIELPELKVKSWEEYEAAAMEELRPYYERILKEEGGDVERAKARIEADYQRGIRITREDYEAAKSGQGSQIQPGETAQDYYNRVKNEFGTFPEEGVALMDNLAKRGISHSGIAAADTSKMMTSQQRRQEAIQKAMQRYEEESGIKRARNIEDIGTAWERRQFELGEKKKTDAAALGRQKRTDDIALQEIERANIMRKAIQNVYG